MYSPSGNQIATHGWSDNVRIWDVETGDCSFILPGHYGFNNLTYSPQENQVAASSDDSTVRVWDTRTGACRNVFIGHNVRVWSVVYSPKGDQIASGGSDGSVRIWDIEEGTCLWTLSGHSNEVNRVVYSSRGNLVASASHDKSVRVWDVTSGQLQAVIQDFQASVHDIDWIESHGLNYFVAGCADGVVGMWQVLVDGDLCHVSLKWKTTNGELDVKDADIHDVRGLSQLNRKLLKQRGAVGEPAHRLREAGKKVATMVSVVSKLKSPSDGTVEVPTFTNSDLAKELEQTFEQKYQQTKESLEQTKESLEQKFQQTKDSLFKDVMAVVEKNIHGRE
jgi:uncharacterized protein with WD repeat